MNDVRDDFPCPHCQALCRSQERTCRGCGLALEWLRGFPTFLQALRGHGSKHGASRDARPAAPGPIAIHAGAGAAAIPLDVGARVVLGRGVSDDPNTRQIVDQAVELRHAVIVRQPGAGGYWIADCGTASGTWVNRKPVTAARLASGDLVQIGAHAWTFGGEDGWLTPARAIRGVRLTLRGVGLGQRLRQIDLQIEPGQFVAITGPSGAGKSTLMKAMIGEPGGRDRGLVLADGHDTLAHVGWFRSLLGYVSQKEAVHADLTARQAVRFSAKLRRAASRTDDVERLLREVDLPRKRWDDCRHSGGESKRIRTATELVAEPRLLVLDEPTSGLDRDRETSLLRLLRSLSYRGCTILVVTHNLTSLDWFDRVLVLRKGGELALDLPPAELKRLIPSGDLADLKLDAPQSPAPASAKPHAAAPAPETTSPGPRRLTLAARSRNLWRQAQTLFGRECALLRNFPGRRLLLPIAVAPLLFAAAIGLAVPATENHLLGFLSALASVWMGSSLSLMAIVNEREVYEHERLLFLRIGPYVGAKLLALWLLSAAQTAVFLLALTLIRDASRRPDDMLFGLPWCFVYLCLIGFAAVGLGLWISALSGHDKAKANYILPLVMMLQIVFSVEVAGKRDAGLAAAYGEFNLHACARDGPDGCQRRAQRWTPQYGWLCDKCRAAAPGFKRQVNPADDQTENEKRPARLAALASYATISRYGDIALRSFAYNKQDYRAFQRAYQRNNSPGATARSTLTRFGGGKPLSRCWPWRWAFPRWSSARCGCKRSEPGDRAP